LEIDMRDFWKIRKSTHRTGLPAFTLVELLVVIAIIALLLSILMPSLQKAREAAKAVVCKSNFHQVALAVPMYVDSYNGLLPPYTNTHLSAGNGFQRASTNAVINGVTYSLFRQYALMREWDAPGSGPSEVRDGGGYFGPYLATREGSREEAMEKVLGCASLPVGKTKTVELNSAGTPFPAKVKHYCSYGLNVYDVTSGLNTNPALSHIAFSKFKRPGSLAYICETGGALPYVASWCIQGEETGESPFWEDYQYQGVAAGNRHNGRFSAVFLDGHIEYERFENLFTREYFIRKQ
jgi:prepilin-type N-terminal cleavage/methylation domain-containing protein/prepilin-type processing-associated H-X9-DG protein